MGCFEFITPTNHHEKIISLILTICYFLWYNIEQEVPVENALFEGLLVLLVMVIGMDVALSGLFGNKVKLRLTPLLLKGAVWIVAGAIWLVGVTLRETGARLVGLLQPVITHGWRQILRVAGLAVGNGARYGGAGIVAIAGAINSHLRAKPAAHGHHGGHNPHP